MEEQTSVQSSSLIENFVNNIEKLLKTKYRTFLVIRYFKQNLKVFLNTSFALQVKNPLKEQFQNELYCMV